MDYKFKNDVGDAFYLKGHQNKTIAFFHSSLEKEFWDTYLDTNSKNFKIGNVDVSFMNNEEYTIYFNDYSKKHERRTYNEIKIENDGKTVLDIEGPNKLDVKLEDVIEGIVAFVYARKNALPAVTDGKAKRKIKKLSLEELTEIETKINEIEETFKTALQDALNGKQVDFQGLLDEKLGKGACDLKQKTQSYIDDGITRNNKDRLERERKEKIREDFRRGVTKLSSPIRMAREGLDKLKDNIVQGACRLKAQIKQSKEINDQKKQVLLNIQDKDMDLDA